MTSKNLFSSKTFFCQSCKFKNQNFNEQSLAEKKKKPTSMKKNLPLTLTKTPSIPKEIIGGSSDGMYLKRRMEQEGLTRSGFCFFFASLLLFLVPLRDGTSRKLSRELSWLLLNLATFDLATF